MWRHYCVNKIDVQNRLIIVSRWWSISHKSNWKSAQNVRIFSTRLLKLPPFVTSMKCSEHIVSRYTNIVSTKSHEILAPWKRGRFNTGNVVLWTRFQSCFEHSKQGRWIIVHWLGYLRNFTKIHENTTVCAGNMTKCFSVGILLF